MILLYFWWMCDQFWVLLEAFGRHIFNRFGVKIWHFWVHFGSFLKLLEASFAPLRPPGAPPGSWGTLGTSQDSPRSDYESLLGHSGADFGPTWPQHEPTWSQLGPKVAPTWGILEPTWRQVGPKITQVGHLEANLKLSGGILMHTRQQNPKLNKICTKIVSKMTLSKGVKC